MRSKPIILIDTGIIGGPGRGLFQLLRELKQQSSDYLLCNFRYRKPKSEEFINEAKKHQFTLALLDQRFRLDPLPIWQFFKLLKRGRYNIIQSHGYKSHLVAAIVSKFTGVPWVAFTHGSTREDLKVTLYHKLDQFLLRFPTVVVTVSPLLTKTFSKLRGKHKRTELILNAVDSADIAGERGGEAVRRDCEAPADTVLIGCFGRLSFEKGQDILLQAFAQIHEHFAHTKLLILGSGLNKPMLESMCIKLGIKDKVYFTNHSSAMRDYYEAIDLLVLPSRSEGLPNVVLEAMIFKVPVLASDVGAIREIISHDINGWIVESGDQNALALSLRKLLLDKSQLKRMGKIAHDSLGTKFCPRIRAKKILALYESVL